MVGKIIRYMRRRGGLYQTELAEKLGVKQGTFSGYETDYSEPNFSAVQKIAEACGFQVRFADLSTNNEYILSSDGEIRKIEPIKPNKTKSKK